MNQRYSPRFARPKERFTCSARAGKVAAVAASLFLGLLAGPVFSQENDDAAEQTPAAALDESAPNPEETIAAATIAPALVRPARVSPSRGAARAVAPQAEPRVHAYEAEGVGPAASVEAAADGADASPQPGAEAAGFDGAVGGAAGSASSAMRALAVQARAPGGSMRALGGGGSRRSIGAAPAGGSPSGGASAGGARRAGGTGGTRTGAYRQLNFVRDVTAPAAGQDGAAAKDTLDRGWDTASGGSGSNGRGGGSGGAGQPTTWPGGGGSGEVGPDGGPLTETGEDPTDAKEPASKELTPWKKLLESAGKFMDYAGKLLSVASLLRFVGDQLMKTGWGAAYGGYFIQAALALAQMACGLAAAATAIGLTILLKYKQKLQGAVITVSALALTVAAYRAAQGDQTAAQNAADKIQQAQSTAGETVNQYLHAAKTGATLAWGKTKEMRIINGVFGVYDGVSGLMAPGASGQDAFKAGIGLLQTVEGFAPIKGPTGDIVRTALTGMGVAAEMWPTGPERSPAPAPASGNGPGEGDNPGTTADKVKEIKGSAAPSAGSSEGDVPGVGAPEEHGAPAANPCGSGECAPSPTAVVTATPYRFGESVAPPVSAVTAAPSSFGERAALSAPEANAAVRAPVPQPSAIEPSAPAELPRAPMPPDTSQNAIIASAAQSPSVWMPPVDAAPVPDSAAAELSPGHADESPARTASPLRGFAGGRVDGDARPAEWARSALPQYEAAAPAASFSEVNTMAPTSNLFGSLPTPSVSEIANQVILRAGQAQAPNNAPREPEPAVVAPASTKPSNEMPDAPSAPNPAFSKPSQNVAELMNDAITSRPSLTLEDITRQVVGAAPAPAANVADAGPQISPVLFAYRNMSEAASNLREAKEKLDTAVGSGEASAYDKAMLKAEVTSAYMKLQDAMAASKQIRSDNNVPFDESWGVDASVALRNVEPSPAPKNSKELYDAAYAEARSNCPKGGGACVFVFDKFDGRGPLPYTTETKVEAVKANEAAQLKAEERAAERSAQSEGIVAARVGVAELAKAAAIKVEQALRLNAAVDAGNAVTQSSEFDTGSRPEDQSAGPVDGRSLSKRLSDDAAERKRINENVKVDADWRDSTGRLVNGALGLGSALGSVLFDPKTYVKIAEFGEKTQTDPGGAAWDTTVAVGKFVKGIGDTTLEEIGKARTALSGCIGDGSWDSCSGAAGHTALALLPVLPIGGGAKALEGATEAAAVARAAAARTVIADGANAVKQEAAAAGEAISALRRLDAATTPQAQRLASSVVDDALNAARPGAAKELPAVVEAGQTAAAARVAADARDAMNLADNFATKAPVAAGDLVGSELAASAPGRYDKWGKAAFQDGAELTPLKNGSVVPHDPDLLEAIGRQAGNDCTLYACAATASVNKFPLSREALADGFKAQVRADAEAVVKNAGSVTEQALKEAQDRLRMLDMGRNPSYAQPMNKVVEMLDANGVPFIAYENKWGSVISKEAEQAVIDNVKAQASAGRATMVAINTGEAGEHAQHALAVLGYGTNAAGKPVFRVFDSNVGFVADMPAELFRPYAMVVVGVKGEVKTGATGAAAAERAGAGAAPDAARYERYLSADEIRAAHPEPASGPVYHNLDHTEKVADMAGEFAKARGLAPADSKFVSEVALLHDFDPTRAAGMPARVPETLARLREDFAGTQSLTGEPGRSILKERFGWTESQLGMAEAMIQRTEFPFAATHPNPAYAAKGPLALYEESLQAMNPGDRRFVLREAPLLSEYADKSSMYATQDFSAAYRSVEGLASEINRAIGKEAMNAGNLGTSGFLSQIGTPASFLHDMALAERFGVKLELPSRAEAFKILPEQYGRTFEDNLRRFNEYDAAIKAGAEDAAAFKQAAAPLESAPMEARAASARNEISAAAKEASAAADRALGAQQAAAPRELVGAKIEAGAAGREAVPVEVVPPSAASARPPARVFDYMKANLMKPVTGEGDLTVFRGGANRPIRPGDWVTADRDLATNIYAEGGHNGGRQGTLMTASIPAQYLYEIHPGGWVYLPPGTPAATIDRIIRYKGTTMGDMLKRKPGPR